VDVKTRLVQALESFPEGIHYISFRDLVEVEVEVNGKKEILRTGPYNESRYVVFADDGSAWVNRNFYDPIEVHPNLKGKLWVFGFKGQRETQSAT
jgi:hypothetical protein